METMSNSDSDFTMKDGVLSFKGETKTFCTTVKGRRIINSTPGGRKRQKRRAWREARKDWIKQVECAVKTKRAGAPWIPADRYAVTLQFRFCRHEKERLDVDNYVKPVLDGLALGLGVDDSNFRILLIHRLPDAETPEEEGVRLFVSSSGNAPPG